MPTKIWGLRVSPNDQFKMVPSMAHAYVEQRQNPSLSVFLLEIDEAGMVNIIDGPIDIFKNGRLYGDQANRGYSILRVLLALSSGFWIAEMTHSTSLAAFGLFFLALGSYFCIASLHHAELSRSLERLREFSREVQRLAGTPRLLR